jgi:hypothetical protein
MGFQKNIHGGLHYLIPSQLSRYNDIFCSVLSRLSSPQNVGISSPATGRCWNGFVSLFGEHWAVGPEREEGICAATASRSCRDGLSLQHHPLVQPLHSLFWGVDTGQTTTHPLSLLSVFVFCKMQLPAMRGLSFSGVATLKWGICKETRVRCWTCLSTLWHVFIIYVTKNS